MFNLSLSSQEEAITHSDNGYTLDNPALVYLASMKSPNSRRNMGRYLNQIAALLSNEAHHALTFPWQELRFQHLTALRSKLSEDYAPATVNGMLSAVRGVLKAAWKLELIDSDAYHRAIDIANVKGKRLPTGRDLSYRELKGLLEACEMGQPDQPLKGKRDAAIIALLYATGMRRSEIVKLKVRDIDRTSGKFMIRSGKGDKDRTVYVKNRPKKLLDIWLEERGDHEGPLFHPINKGGCMNQDRGISDQAIYNLLKDRAVEAGLEDFTPHDLRRTFVGDALDAGIDLATVAEIAGHASTDTTRRYDRRGERAKEQAAALMDM